MKLPIVLTECIIVFDDFHARYSAVSKEYHYHIRNQEVPCAVGRNCSWHIHSPLDITVMNLCCRLLCGTHDFKSFENTGAPRRSTVRTVFAAEVNEQYDNRLVFRICADGFLKSMVRKYRGHPGECGQA